MNPKSYVPAFRFAVRLLWSAMAAMLLSSCYGPQRESWNNPAVPTAVHISPHDYVIVLPPGGTTTEPGDPALRQYAVRHWPGVPAVTAAELAATGNYAARNLLLLGTPDENKLLQQLHVTAPFVIAADGIGARATHHGRHLTVWGRRHFPGLGSRTVQFLTGGSQEAILAYDPASRPAAPDYVVTRGRNELLETGYCRESIPAAPLDSPMIADREMI
ncbi:MAG: hypothetical protein PHQ27_05725, partial [Victivallales bacterium]|nr:hypothetical protein [Victivallales bacterium]